MPATPDRLAFLRPFVLLSCLGIVLSLLYFTKVVLIPLVLAVLLTFLLAPVVTWLQRKGLPRLPAVVAVVILAFTIFIGLGWVVATQATALVDTLVEQQENLDEKIAAFRAMSEGGLIERIQIVIHRIGREMSEPVNGETSVEVAGQPPVQPVRIVSEETAAFDLAELWAIAGPLLEPFAAAGLVLVLVIFLLIRREDMRDRIISLLGRGRLTMTTKALDEAGQRIGRYLLTQLLINSTFGAAAAVGLFFIGVPYALLWGFLAAVLRYVPYLGPMLAAVLPLAVSLLMTPGWTTPVLVVILFTVLETTTNGFLEPWLYGRNVGVSDAASIVAIAFWTWLWGPIGLVLAMPMTVCLAVVGRYVPQLQFLDTLLGDRPALEPRMGLYQRLLAHDEDEAAEIAEDRLQQSSLEEAYDQVLAPALNYARRDVESDLITDVEHKRMLASIREIARELADSTRAKSVESDDKQADAPELPRITALACPARDETDETAIDMLKQLIDREKCHLEVTNSALLSAELASLVAQNEIKLVCIASVPPGGLSHARYLCMRLRACCPDVKIVVGRWGLTSALDKNRDQLTAAGADVVTFNLAEARQQILNQASMIAAQEAREAPTLQPQA